MPVTQLVSVATEIAAVTSDGFQRLLDVGLIPTAALSLLLEVSDPTHESRPTAVLLGAATWGRLQGVAHEQLRQEAERPEATAALLAITTDQRILEEAAAIALDRGQVGGGCGAQDREVAGLLVDAGADRDRVVHLAIEIASARRHLRACLTGRPGVS